MTPILHLRGGVPPGTVWAEPGVLSATGTRSGRRPMTWLSSTAHHRWLEAETDRLLAFGRAARLPEGGFGWLDDQGNVDPGHPCELWITCRMTYAYALGSMLGRPGAGVLADHGLAALAGRFRDVEHGGWYASVGSDGPVGTDKGAYPGSYTHLRAHETRRDLGCGLLLEKQKNRES